MNRVATVAAVALVVTASGILSPAGDADEDPAGLLRHVQSPIAAPS